jgi:hypothetical protein
VVFHAGRAVAVDVIGDHGRERVAGDRITLAASALRATASPWLRGRWVHRPSCCAPESVRQRSCGRSASRSWSNVPALAPACSTTLRSGVPALAVDGVPHENSVVLEAGLRYRAPDSSDADDIQVFAATLFDPAVSRSFVGQEVRLLSIGLVLVRPRSTGPLTITTPDLPPSRWWYSTTSPIRSM